MSGLQIGYGGDLRFELKVVAIRPIRQDKSSKTNGA
jgi:hypothetical protein